MGISTAENLCSAFAGQRFSRLSPPPSAKHIQYHIYSPFLPSPFIYMKVVGGPVRHFFCPVIL